ncbi:MAG: dienelactone hydrolase family protein, partial [Deltaproteobacteria bacterium]
MKYFLTFLFFFSCLQSSQAAVKTSAVEYSHEKTELEGYLAYDDSLSGPRPGILLMHDWWGIGQFEKQRAEQLAQAGFVVFVADLYGKGTHPKNETEAIRKEATGRDHIQSLRDRANAGLEQLKLSPLVNPKKISAV